jgi:putative membrane protein
MDDPRVYLAAERTYLAWIRTGLALMGFGFVVARFGLFLREIGHQVGNAQEDNTSFSYPLGIGLLVLGVVVLIGSAIRHRRYIQALDRGEFRSAFNSSFALIITGALVIFGLALGISLIQIR